MNEQLQKMINDIREKLGLHQHEMKRYDFYREKNHLDETTYIFSMEWFPNGSEASDDGSNPAGTAVVDIDFHSGSVRRLIFVRGVNSADNSLYPTSSVKENVIEWIEEMTGLTFGRQFLIDRDEEKELRFEAAVDIFRYRLVGRSMFNSMMTVC
ncbi:hypothetical protein [Lentibacillus sp. CBA3610]|uniref:hypothetical protein n=1 Tax=Lentibacillus sp. CBA3610 TaxID=2518176 RepID=UPI001595AE4D|nr:hypothetical protein [Lentibacillus sp. CBA3610]QKY70618.1 hypothetical protein Len3610_14375 [Lentibacillus sp. CBA3610]